MDALREHLRQMFPNETIVSVDPLLPDSGATRGRTQKAAGYGQPVRIVLADVRGRRRALVWRTATANEFGHDRRADRVAAQVQAYEDFAHIPEHIAGLDLGFVVGDGALQSIRDAGEPYLITTYAEGTIYAEDLRRIARERRVSDRDLHRLDALVDCAASLHVPIAGDGAVAYRRAIRDLVGSGEGIFGIVDGYPEDTPAANRSRLKEIEERCASWRWRLRERHERLTRTHGDFHPFNIVFDDDDEPTLLDASRGACGDPADDVTALAINFLLFAIDEPGAWRHGLGVLWHRWWTEYAVRRDDPDLRVVAPPFFAWRTLVVCNPRFYPRLSARGRDRLLVFAEDALDQHDLDPRAAEELFT